MTGGEERKQKQGTGRASETQRHTQGQGQTLSDFLPTLAMTVVSAVTEVGSFKQDSMETATAIQMENTSTSHGKVHRRCHKSKEHCTAGTDRDRAQTMQGRKNVGKINI